MVLGVRGLCVCLCVCVASNGFVLLNLLPKEQEARLWLCCTEGLAEVLRMETWLCFCPFMLKAEHSISLSLIWVL